MNTDSPIRETLEAALSTAAVRLAAADFPSGMADAFRRLAQQVREPFVLAVVGMVKAGKSSLVNTLLGDDLAKVGATETTATVNWFRYGTPDPDKPIRCYRRGQAKPELHSRAFLDRLQGDDEETLRLGSDIDRIEYLVACDWLRPLVLVDTPGLGAVSDEHQDRTLDFVRLNSLLRERHHQETQRLAQEADAILYVLPPPLRSNDRAFLEEFRGMVRQGTSAFNAIAVIGKYDEHDDGDLTQGQYRAAKLALQLGAAVHTVIPVSAGVHRFVQKLRSNQADCDDFLRFIRETAEEEFSAMTDMHNHYLTGLDCPIAPERRATIAEGLPWASVRSASLYIHKNQHRRPTEVLDDLARLAGISELRALIDRTFIASGALLRYYRIVQDAEAILKAAGYEHVEACRSAGVAAKALEARFHTVLKRLAPAALPQDRKTVDEIAAFVTRHLTQASGTDGVSTVLDDLLAGFAKLRRSLEASIEDIDARQTLIANEALFTPAEREELESLFGKHGTDLANRLRHAPDPKAYITSRQSYWQARSQVETQATRLKIARMAAARYGTLLFALNGR